MSRKRLKFDLYVAVDWSAQSQPRRGKDSIWIATSEGLCVNPPTRGEAYRWLLRHLRRWSLRGVRVFVGWDFPFGLPEGGCALVLGRRGALWKDWWSFLEQAVRDDARNRNNRFWVAQHLNRQAGGGGPFWGWKGKTRIRGVPPRKPRFPFRGVGEYRECDLQARFLHRWVSSPFQMTGAGAVGSQMIMGIPYVHRLWQDPALKGTSFLYPFEMRERREALNERGSINVHAEVFLPIVPFARDLFPKDKNQVLSFVSRAERKGGTGELAEVFSQVWELPCKIQKKVLKEEGWALII